MTLMIGKIIQIEKKQGLIQNLQGEMIPFEMNKAGPVNRSLRSDMMVLFDAYLLDSEEGKRLEALNLRKLDKNVSETTLTACIKDADPMLVRKMYSYLDSQVISSPIEIMCHPSEENPQNQYAQSSSATYVVNNQQHFQKFLSIIYRCNKRPDLQIRYSPDDILSAMSHDDEKLAEMWLPKNPNHKNELLAQMLSARIAEKVAQCFYRNLMFDVTDIALTQLSGNSKEWRKYDIILNERICVDVKNARSTLNNKFRYVEYCVPEFKYTRQGDEVVIAGVFSPYLRLNEIRGKDIINREIDGFLFLGETTYSTIRLLESKFSGQRIKVEIQKPRNFNGKNGSTLPPWVFDYPDVYYQEQDNWRNQLKEYDNSKYPHPNQWMKGFTPVPALIACARPIPYEWAVINDMQREFIFKLLKNSPTRIKLPVLYLTILNDFLERVSSASLTSQFSPEMYNSLLYRPGTNSNVLGICDPLDIIADLIETLQLVWDNRTNIPWEKIEFFRFTGLGILVGQKYTGETITILAYCGGVIDKKGKCGYSPLVIGKNKTCCNGKLICEKCGFCCKKCNNTKRDGSHYGYEGIIDDEVDYYEIFPEYEENPPF